MPHKDPIMPKNMWVPIVLTLACNTLAYYGSRLLTADRPHFNLSNGFDDRIPLLPWTVVIYFGCYLFWIINYVIGCRQDSKEAFRFISADFFAKLVCLVCFLLFPTTNTRPAIVGDSLWDGLMRLLYQVDAADNLFPSIHCLTSCFCYIAVRGNKKIPKWYQITSFWIAVSIYISTLTTKQHVWYDVAAGVALAEFSYWFVEKSGFAGWYTRAVMKINRMISRKLSR